MQMRRKWTHEPVTPFEAADNRSPGMDGHLGWRPHRTRTSRLAAADVTQYIEIMVGGFLYRAASCVAVEPQTLLTLKLT